MFLFLERLFHVKKRRNGREERPDAGKAQMLPWNWQTDARGYPKQVAPQHCCTHQASYFGRSLTILRLLLQVRIPDEWPPSRDIGHVIEDWGDSFGGHYILRLRPPAIPAQDAVTARSAPRLRGEPSSIKLGGSVWLHDHTLRGDNILSLQQLHRQRARRRASSGRFEL